MIIISDTKKKDKITLLVQFQSSKEYEGGLLENANIKERLTGSNEDTLQFNCSLIINEDWSKINLANSLLETNSLRALLNELPENCECEIYDEDEGLLEIGSVELFEDVIGMKKRLIPIYLKLDDLEELELRAQQLDLLKVMSMAIDNINYN